MIVIFVHVLLLTFWLALAVTMTSAKIPFLISKVCNHNLRFDNGCKAYAHTCVILYPTCVKERNRIPQIFALIC